MEQSLIAAASLAISQLINKRVAPAALELSEIGVDQNRALNAFVAGSSGVPAGFGGHPRQSFKQGVGIALKVRFPGSSVIAVKPVPAGIQGRVRRLPCLIVGISAVNPGD